MSDLTLMTKDLPVDRALISTDAPMESLLGLDVEGYSVVMDAEIHRRIVACVNACRGVETEAMEKHIAEGQTILTNIQKTYTALTLAQNDAIAANDRAHVAKVELGDALRERDEARAMVKRLADALRNLDECDDYEELIDEADPLNIPETTMCPSCYFVWPGHPTRCEACHTILDEEPHA